MFRIRKRVFDTYWVKKCNRNICKCIVSLKDKESISIKEVQRHRDCYNCDIINRTINNKERQSLILKLNEADRSYPPLL